MPGVTERTLAVLEFLATQMEGTPLALISDQLEIPRSACHRLLADLKQCGYVRQLREQGDYVLTTKLVGLGLSYLATSGIIDVAQTMLDRLAETSGELVRLAIVDGDRLTWVAKSQGALKGLRYDPDMGMDTILSCSATGHAWMMTMTDERALELVTRQGFGQPKQYGPNAPTTVKALLGFVDAARARGYATIYEVFAPGMTAMAAPVQRRGYPAIGVISIAGPAVRLTEKRMTTLGPALMAAANELAAASLASPLLGRVR
ncbi:IclR family transcriptional regulator [Paraburkholderia nemoris]|uniref:Transcriptional repressor IclR n=1 Tax=Paraburkholderia nemoris TaxID=2793076 RepID=A0ABN7L2S9_9BURK|nr:MULTISPECIES: IclR family transcriptional regulator [Paraburkholderia]MBK5148738.1 IclR family transcriptional regulator [Burkholderia sp. R-69608]MBK3809227.1 IclR family transcriptional regulator [Paraburkholderia aspalathi]CAE6720627.1 Transcriptional repressor IclR [Paraburkholderia nemoris]CAE6723190.1 Transcriptional repressor IclR [Paraburkholderia nemoris]CAE6908983.1 Transcriptional repressor IclR [Paraburkholderia nemoris]